MIILKKLLRPLIVFTLLCFVGGCQKPPAPNQQLGIKAAASEVRPVKVLLPPPPPHAKMTIPAWAQGKTIRRVNLKPGVKAVALTFDDGPWPHYTHLILAVLKQHEVKATFFMVGQELSRRPEIGRHVLSAGHVIGNHSWNHPSRPQHAVSQVKRTDSEIFKQLKIYSHLFRPPYGIETNGMAAQAKKEKHAVVLWTIDSQDWRPSSASTIARTVVRQAHPGAIILMHDGGGNRLSTVGALKILIPQLKQKGYKFVTVPELLEMRYTPPRSQHHRRNQ